jgi:hypothetical protein
MSYNYHNKNMNGRRRDTKCSWKLQATSPQLAQYKMQNTEHKFDQESGTTQTSDLAEKVDLIAQSKY